MKLRHLHEKNLTLNMEEHKLVKHSESATQAQQLRLVAKKLEQLQRKIRHR
jgi:hypothetical protein